VKVRVYKLIRHVAINGLAAYFSFAADITSARRWHRLQSCPSFESLVWKDLFYDFGSDDTHLVAGDEPFVLKEDEDFAVVCARLNYHFNSGY
jgi:hypothetical protein